MSGVEPAHVRLLFGRSAKHCESGARLLGTVDLEAFQSLAHVLEFPLELLTQLFDFVVHLFSQCGLFLRGEPVLDGSSRPRNGFVDLFLDLVGLLPVQTLDILEQTAALWGFVTRFFVLLPVTIPATVSSPVSVEISVAIPLAVLAKSPPRLAVEI